MARPPITTLRLTEPRIRGALVREVQHRFRGHGLEQDGVYGCRTAAAVADWQWRTGAPHHAGAIVPAEMIVLLGYRRRPSSWIRRGRERKGQANPRAVTCAPTPAALEIVPRHEWIDFDPRGVSVVNHYPGVGHVVHWFGPGSAADGRAAGTAQALRFARYHRFALGWADIGYGFVILRDAEPGGLCTVLEGRGDNVRGAHSGHNSANAQPGVLVLCGTGTPTPTPEQLATLKALRTLKRWGRRTGHLEWSATSCPGPVLWPWVVKNR